MARKRSTILMVIIGIAVCMFVVGAGTATWFYLSFDSVDAERAVATRSLDEARARFKGQQPILELRDDKISLLRKAPDVASTRDLQNVHVLTWNAEEETLTTLTLPFWLLRLRDSGVDVSLTHASR